MGRGLVEGGLSPDSAIELKAMSKEQTFRSEATDARISSLRSSSSSWSEPLSLDNFGGEFRMPSGEKKGVIDERAEEVFGGIQA